jgi:hypothetical protein
MPRVTRQSVCIPQEISNYIIGYLHSDASALLCCSLVCKAWLFSSREYLFQVVALNHQNVDSFASLIISSLSTIPPHVKRLQLVPEHIDRRWLRRLVPFLEVFTSVTILRLENVDWVSLPPTSRANLLSNLRLTLTSLHLRDIVFETFGDVVDIICDLPLLRSVDLEGVNWGDTKRSSTIVKYLPPSVKELRLQACPLRKFLAWLLAQTPIPIIDHLDIGPIGESDILEVARYIVFLGHRLHTLKMSFRCEENGHRCSDNLVFDANTSQTVPTPLDSKNNSSFRISAEFRKRVGGGTCSSVSQLTHLRSIHIKDFVQASSGATHRGVRTLVSITSFNLQEVVMEVTLGKVAELDVHTIDWDFLDRVFATPIYANVRMVKFRVRGAVKRDALAALLSSRLPQCVERGILLFE